jgi:hypothetical protein
MSDVARTILEQLGGNRFITMTGPYIVRVWAVCGGTYDDAFENMDDALRESDRLNYSDDWAAVVYDADGVEVF